MNTTELISAYRTDTSDTVRPYLWQDAELIRFAAQAHLMFHRLTEGVADRIELEIVNGEHDAILPAGTLRIMDATLRSTGRPLRVINLTEKPRHVAAGAVTMVLIGAVDGKVRWVNTPVSNDICDMHVRRLPHERITGLGQEIPETDELHHHALLEWMKHLAFKKPDAETFDPRASATAEAVFRTYCEQAKAERERAKHKTRVVQYGGL